MNKKDNRLKELKRLRYECNEIIKVNKNKLKKINEEVKRLENERILKKKRTNI